VVGTGWRAEPYLRLAAVLPDRFGVTGIVAHSEASQEGARRDWGVEVYADLDAALAAERPDLVVLSVPWPVTPVLVRRLVELDLPVLTETPPAPDLDGLHALWAVPAARGVPGPRGRHGHRAGVRDRRGGPGGAPAVGLTVRS
jgi:predicted dehydrogenase